MMFKKERPSLVYIYFNKGFKKIWNKLLDSQINNSELKEKEKSFTIKSLYRQNKLNRRMLECPSTSMNF